MDSNCTCSYASLEPVYGFRPNKVADSFFCLYRNVEADVALRSTAAVFTYCRSRGLFAGISLEGSYLIERKDTNRKCVWQQSVTAFQWTHRPWPSFLGVSDPQVLLQRHTCIRHFERRRGATIRMFWSLPHLGGIHWGLYSRLDQQEYVSQGNVGHYWNKFTALQQTLDRGFVCFVLPVFWSSIQASSSSSAEGISQLWATNSRWWQWCLSKCKHLLFLMMLKVFDCFYVFRCDYRKEKCSLPKYFHL